MCIGIGGINYNLKTGMEVFGWANGDRAEPGVSTDGVGNDGQKNGYRRARSHSPWLERFCGPRARREPNLGRPARQDLNED